MKICQITIVFAEKLENLKEININYLILVENHVIVLKIVDTLVYYLAIQVLVLLARFKLLI
jgi:hypothetical protein